MTPHIWAVTWGDYAWIVGSLFALAAFGHWLGKPFIPKSAGDDGFVSPTAARQQPPDHVVSISTRRPR